ncbi:hypothetical protein PSTT_02583 [Puccinia striiformis]|uniref:DH domain-containing protein n=1 Tax=Puccinia striiformis TaxID=27350 RepID=A0A2S4VZZ6_9BASI|nr:hypothetical protein PSTT_02583 [Puccinia striiformis]
MKEYQLGQQGSRSAPDLVVDGILQRRLRALIEIIETEDGYLKDLKRLDNFYLNRIINESSTLKTKDKQIIRRNIAQLIELAERFNRRISIAIGKNYNELLRLEEDEAELDRIIERLAKAFISESPIFTIYEEYCARHTEAADLIRAFQATTEWNSLTSPNDFTTTTTLVESSSSGPSEPSRLNFSDYIIKPIQRIMRYPMLLNGLLNQLTSTNQVQLPSTRSRAIERVQQALWAMKQVAEGVDQAKSLREIELKTELIASRMELHSSYRAAFVCLLGQIKLVGSLHILYHGPNLDQSEAFKIKYHGIFLYQTHLVIVKVKRATVYEPRHWFPIRYFDLIDISDNSSLMPYSFSLKYRQHTFEFGATCEPEKRCWINKLRDLKAEIDQLRSIQIMSAIPLSDDSIVSSINLTENVTTTPTTTTTTNTTTTMMTTVVEGTSPSPIEPQPQEEQLVMDTMPTRVSQRLSRNVNTLLGRTAEVAQAAIDLKLTEIFSEVLIMARSHDNHSHHQLGTGGESSRTRTLSATGTISGKRNSNYHQVHTFSRKRMSCLEPSTIGRLKELPPPPIPDQDLNTTSIDSSNSSSTPTTASTSSLRRARSGPALVSNRSQSSLNRSEGTAADESPTLPIIHPSSRQSNTAIVIPVIETNHNSPILEEEHEVRFSPDLCVRCISPDQKLELHPPPPSSSLSKPIENHHQQQTSSGSSSNNSSSSTLWLPGLKMVRKLSRVGSRPSPSTISTTTSTTSASNSTGVNGNKKVNARMDRQASAPSTSSRPSTSPHPHQPSSSTTATTTTTITTNEGYGNTFKRVFMKRNRSCVSTPSTTDHPHLLSSTSESHPLISCEEKENKSHLKNGVSEAIIKSSSSPSTSSSSPSPNPPPSSTGTTPPIPEGETKPPPQPHPTRSISITNTIRRARTTTARSSSSFFC